MSDVKKTIHIEIPAEVSDENFEMYLRVIEESSSDLPNIYVHTGACEDSDHCYGPGSNAEQAILARDALSQPEPEYEYGVHIASEPVWPDHPFETFKTPEEALALVDYLKIPEYWKVIRRRKAGPWEDVQ